MIDLLEISIQFDASLVETVDERYAFVGVDFKEMNIPLGAKSIHFRDDDTIGTCGLYHPYESLPTSFTGIAMKVNFDGHFFPHITIKGSPAKILQGHNVFGSDDLYLCITEMLFWVQDAYPDLYGMLSIQTAEIRKMDVTYMSRVGSPKLVRSAIDYMSRISNGQTKPTKSKKYETTMYWGGATSRLIRQKCYAKFDEYLAQLEKFKKLSEKGDSHALVIVNVMSDERLIDIARTSLRWECTFMKRWLERNDIPVNAWELIKYQNANPDFLQRIWSKGFEKIFDAMKGLDMTIVNDDKVLARLKAEFGKPLASGRTSYRKAINLFGFYTQLKSMGYQEIKNQELYSLSQFNRLVGELRSAGFSLSFLQNLHVSDPNTKTVPFVNLINIDFSQQTPDWYVEPLSTPQKLRLVA
ncbi:MAG: replication initiation protein [Inoviridae sp.]|nr:MAG: replication initiation protein [Inoviridae sp.]